MAYIYNGIVYFDATRVHSREKVRSAINAIIYLVDAAGRTFAQREDQQITGNWKEERLRQTYKNELMIII